MTVTLMSKSDAFLEKSDLNSFMSWYNSQFGKNHTWATRVSMQTEAQRRYASENIRNRIISIDSILANPANITRWDNEDKAEEKRLLDIKLEKERILKEAEDLRLNTEFRLFYLQDIENKRLQQIKDQEITFNEQINSGDFNETPITDVNVNGGCSECTTGTDLETGMTNDQLEKEPLNYMKIAGITAIGLIGLMVVRK